MVINNFDKQALKENSYTVLSRITIVGTDIVFTEDDAIVDWNYEDYRYVPGTGFIGQFVERILDGNLQNISEDVILEDKEINLQIGIVNGLNSQTTWYDYGNFLITKVSETDTTGNFKFESCDYTKKFNAVYEDNISYPTISLALANNVCEQANVELQPDGYCHFYVIPKEGLAAGNYNFNYNGTYYNFTLANDLNFYDTLMYVKNTGTLILKSVDSSFNVTRNNLEVTEDSSATGTTLIFTRIPYVDFTNNDFVIENNQYESEDTLRKVMQDIGKLAYSWVRVAEDNKVYIDFEQQSEENVDRFDELSTDEYYTSKKSDLYFGPVNKVLIGMKDVDGENLYKTSEDYTEETECAIKIFDNNLTYTEELRAIALDGCDRLFGLKYMPLEIETIGHPWLEGNELIKLTNVDEEELYTYPFNRQIKYAGYIEEVIGAEAQTSQETEYEYTKDIISDVKKTRFIVDKDGQRIDSLIERTEGSESRITELEQTTDSITATVEHLNDEYEQNVVIKKTAEGNPIEVEDAGNYALNNFKLYGATLQEPTPEEAGTTIQINGSATLTDVDTSKESRVLRLLGQTSQNGTPTPSSPIPVNVVSGDNEINICGKNLEQEIELGGIGNQGQNYVNNIQIRSKYYNLVKPNTTYALSFNGALSGFNVAQYDKDKTFISFTFHGGTITTSENTRYIRINKTATLDDKVQIEKGSTATTYEPYIGNTYPIYLGVENLFDYENTTFNNNSTGTTTKTSEYVKAIPNTTSNYSGFYVNNNTLPNITTTSLSFKAKADSSRTINVVYFNKSITITLTTEWQTFKVENATHNSNSMDFYSGSDHSGVAFYVKDIQIEKGSKTNSFTPYGTTPIELCKIGTYQDYIYKDNGSWYLHKEIGKVVLDGSESWEVGEYGTNSYRLSAYPYGSIIDAITVVNIITNLFRGVPFDRRVVEGDNIIYDDSNYFYIRNTSITSLANFKALLETTNMIVYYILATPTNTLIEDTTLISQLDALESQ